MSHASFDVQQPVKLSHLWSGGPLCGCVIVRLVCNWVLVLVKMSHPSAAACQDVPSFVRWPIVCVIVRLVCNWVLVVVIRIL